MSVNFKVGKPVIRRDNNFDQPPVKQIGMGSATKRSTVAQ